MSINIKKILHVSTVATVAAVIFSCGGTSTSSGGGASSDGGRQSQRQAKAEVSAEKEYKQATKDIEKIRDLRVKLRGLNIPCDIGTGTAATAAEALSIATEEARAAAIANVGFQVQGFSATYAHNVAAGSRKTWEDRVTEQASKAVEQAVAYKSVTQRNRAEGTFTATVLIILDPVIFKQALSDATFVNREFQQRARNDHMMAKMDAVIKDFNSKYRKDK